jgi:hypothetical protein
MKAAELEWFGHTNPIVLLDSYINFAGQPSAAAGATAKISPSAGSTARTYKIVISA